MTDRLRACRHRAVRRSYGAAKYDADKCPGSLETAFAPTRWHQPAASDSRETTDSSGSGLKPWDIRISGRTSSARRNPSAGRSDERQPHGAATRPGQLDRYHPAGPGRLDGADHVAERLPPEGQLRRVPISQRLSRHAWGSVPESHSHLGCAARLGRLTARQGKNPQGSGPPEPLPCATRR